MSVFALPFAAPRAHSATRAILLASCLSFTACKHSSSAQYTAGTDSTNEHSEEAPQAPGQQPLQCILRWKHAVEGAPEACLIHEDSVFVSNMGGEENGDAGYLSVLPLDGGQKPEKVVGGDILENPMGMAILGETLYLADMTRVVGFDMNSWQQVFDLSLKSHSVTFLNDLVPIDEFHLAATGTSTRKIYLIDVRKGGRAVPFQTDTTLTGINGIEFDADRQLLYVVQNEEASHWPNNGSLLRFSRKGVQLTLQQRSEAFGTFVDGVAFDDDRILVSSWTSWADPGMLFSFDRDALSLRSQHEIPVVGFADISVKPKGLLATPDMMNKEILLYECS